MRKLTCKLTALRYKQYSYRHCSFESVLSAHGVCVHRGPLYTLSAFILALINWLIRPASFPLSLSSFSLCNDEKKETYVPLWTDRTQALLAPVECVCIWAGLKLDIRCGGARHVTAGTLLIFVRVSINGAEGTW